MTPRREWPPYASPGWIAFYAVGVCAWAAIAEAWGFIGCLVVIGVGALLAAAAARALDAGGDDDR